MKKLEKQFKLGQITEAEKQSQLDKIGRNNLKKENENGTIITQPFFQTLCC